MGLPSVAYGAHTCTTLVPILTHIYHSPAVPTFSHRLMLTGERVSTFALCPHPPTLNTTRGALYRNLRAVLSRSAADRRCGIFAAIPCNQPQGKLRVED
jgi:hypothetical protein